MLPDQSHINRVRDALWVSKGGRATVMLGAGFSRNANKKSVSRKDFPLWHDITTKLCELLYPDSSDLKHALSQAAGTSGFLKLAQEYKVAFGRDALDTLIDETIPDDDYMPGDLHKRMVRLPWCDIFTTNWDTLIEKSSIFAADRNYSTIIRPEQLISAPPTQNNKTPRIFKIKQRHHIHRRRL
ncbi:hypothetical protein [Pseudomonas sp. CFII64]|uniref:hypothetical protein n=1 Tax=Pseudomonas sp. CFII64 TaxID=911242 RepID=UPI0012EB09B4|nr:hypothetical protein [Pseudomonas sp. CFII64]